MGPDSALSGIPMCPESALIERLIWRSAEAFGWDQAPSGTPIRADSGHIDLIERKPSLSGHRQISLISLIRYPIELIEHPVRCEKVTAGGGSRQDPRNQP